MAVAKSYENMTLVGEPYERDKKMYVRVTGPCKRCGGSGNYSYNPKDGYTCFRCSGSGKETLEVRWYTDAQRAAMDKRAQATKAAKEAEKEQRKINARTNYWGFGEGYITLLSGDQHVINDWAHETDPCRARYNMMFGWFVPSNKPMPELPEGVTGVRLNWEDVCADETSLKDFDEVERKVKEIRGDYVSPSEYQGAIGEWLTIEVTVREKYSSNGMYGDKTTHIMTDANNNIYQWGTGTKNYEIGTVLTLKMKVKEHKEYKGEKRTVVWYCKDVK